MNVWVRLGWIVSKMLVNFGANSWWVFCSAVFLRHHFSITQIYVACLQVRWRLWWWTSPPVCLWTQAWTLTSYPLPLPHRKTISVRIVDQEEYDKKASFYVELQEPYWDRRRWTGVRTHLYLPELWPLLLPSLCCSFLLSAGLLLVRNRLK